MFLGEKEKVSRSIRFYLVLCFVCVFVPTGIDAQSVVTGKGTTIDFYGFIRTDLILDSQRPNSAQTPQWIVDGTEENFTMHPRLTRFGMNYTGGEVGDFGTIGGKLEIDFQNGGSDSRALPRYRHAYMTLDMGNSELLIGQTWDLVSPLYPAANSDTLMWNVGNLGDRRTQMRYTMGLGEGLNFAVAAGLTGAVDQKDRDGNGIKDGEESGMPGLQARLGMGGIEGLEFGIGLATAEESSLGESYDTNLVTVDFKYALSEKFTLKGEYFTGSNLSDFRGGIAQGINAAGEEIDSTGGWVEVGTSLGENWNTYVGYTFDDPDDDQVDAGGRLENTALYVTNKWQWSSYGIGLDFIQWTTTQDGIADDLEDNRVNLYFTYTF